MTRPRTTISQCLMVTSFYLLLLGSNHHHYGIQAFIPSSVSRKTSWTTQRNMMEFLPHHDPVVVSETLDHLQKHIVDTQSFLLAADVPAADAAAAAAVQQSSWWDNYIKFYRDNLVNIHDFIDGPFRSVGITQTWGPSIFIFTAGVRSLLIPLSIQQTKSSEYMKALAPYQKEIRLKFADNKDRMNRALGKLFQDANANPLAGCATSFVQIPVFLGLYRGVTSLAKEGKLQEPFLWIPSLEGPVSPPLYRGLDWLTEGWHPVDGQVLPEPSLGWPATLAFVVMPIILVLGQSVTMRVLSPPLDENASDEEREQMEKTQGILKFLPLMIGFFSLQVPAGLTIYWLTSNTFTLLQSVSVRAYFKANPPKVELPEYWEDLNKENMTPEEQREAAKAGLAKGPSIEDLLDEARFHYVVMRTPIREGSESWERVKDAEFVIPEEMKKWVQEEASVGSPTSVSP
eukprot:CAMPEP_0118703082 /NCGR_PEP_ID=MMETSP0800-20121206/18313_1 /TAXON_ID=210618 ORGANISM="Striatella unipunctata, Strain CCMP2910" /NCGR_SAMPLE_ID=MMETSP0800 /ASSEMBLY_ACC=CAM_ASM_000638 /LENGTH=457 /DNA_ID=CAMNT_0006604483 /DNA_START=93 /DNA_END=1466 /DNA_ORIENTATION=+